MPCAWWQEALRTGAHPSCSGTSNVLDLTTAGDWFAKVLRYTSACGRLHSGHGLSAHGRKPRPVGGAGRVLTLR